MDYVKWSRLNLKVGIKFIVTILLNNFLTLSENEKY